MGDSVLVSGDTFEPVLGWLAVSHEQDLEFLTLHTNLSRSLRLTGSHVVFTEKAGRPTTKYAADIGVGEVLYHQASGPPSPRYRARPAPATSHRSPPAGRLWLTGSWPPATPPTRTSWRTWRWPRPGCGRSSCCPARTPPASLHSSPPSTCWASSSTSAIPGQPAPWSGSSIRSHPPRSRCKNCYTYDETYLTKSVDTNYCIIATSKSIFIYAHEKEKLCDPEYNRSA